MWLQELNNPLSSNNSLLREPKLKDSKDKVLSKFLSRFHLILMLQQPRRLAQPTKAKESPTTLTLSRMFNKINNNSNNKFHHRE
jgi:hypothetical protein